MPYSSLLRLPVCFVVIFTVTISSSFADNCALNFYGTSYVGLSANSTAVKVFSSSADDDAAQHTFEVWASPSMFVSHEQTILQTGIVESTKAGGRPWAVELNMKLAIWQHGQKKPTSSVVYMDVWTMTDDAGWSKLRYYVIIGEETFPWVHIRFTLPHADGSTASAEINGRGRRLDKYSPVASDDVVPRHYFAVGERFVGAIDEVRIWKTATTAVEKKLDGRFTLCDYDVTTAVLYLPFNECEGDVFVGYNHDDFVCTMMYGAYDAIARPLWTTYASASLQECSPKFTPDQLCANVVRVDNYGVDEDKTNGYYYNSLLAVKGHLSLSIVVIFLVVVLSVYRLRRPTPVVEQPALC